MVPIIKPLYKLDAFNSLIEFVNKKSTPVLAAGVLESQKSHLAYALSCRLNCPIFMITYSENSAKQIYRDFTIFMKEKVNYYPSKDIIFYNAEVRSYEINKQRFKVINSLIQNENAVTVLSIESMLDKMAPKYIFNKYILEYNVGDEVNLDELTKKLITMGYERRDTVELVGQFSVRGGILDIFTVTSDTAVRIEFWGDQIDSMRQLDTLSQRSVDTLEKIRIIPSRETIYDEDSIKRAALAIQAEFEKTYNKYVKNNMSEQADNLKESVSKVLETLKEFHSFSKLDTYVNFFYEECVSILEYLPSNSLIIFDEPKRLSENINFILAEFEETIKNRIENGDILPSQVNMVFSYAEILKRLNGLNTVLFSTLSHRVKDFTVKEIVNFEVKSTSTFKNQITLLLDDLKYWVNNKYYIVILGGTKLRCTHIEESIRNSNLPVVYFNDLDDINLQAGIITVVKGSLRKGFEYPLLKFVVITCDELFGEEKKQNKFKKKKSNAIESFTELKVGDYIVHDNHGIGIYKGIEQIVQNGISRDYLKLQYADGGSIYVNTNQMNFVQKYIGNENIKIKLNKLSTSEWTKTKAKVKNSVKIMAKELISLYSKRQAAKGFSFSKDNIWQAEFEAMFPYEETEDQLFAINDVKADMESNKVMDRLICGDVGYGKTEVAIRAAFKCVQDGKQVAFLVPTTILAQQHYNNFVERMKDFPIEIEMLSRFRTQKQQKESCLRLENGLSDIVVGTHRILSNTLRFKNLGLIIVDEEQRFGVRHKEKLKELRENVDVISLSATPIPRTLHMSLTGIRDMSLLEEPPLERHPVQTYVIEHNMEFIKKAINRELSRNGQVYYLSNRVRNMSELAMKIQNHLPDAKVAYAHGQMSERELENIMMEFIEGNIDVLVCTTIIETGLDISNANTIIIQDADKMGLSQLYQLRGRVGRSNRIAYCYLTYRKNKVLTEVAEKRLQTIRDFTEFGSGFKIAMRDLEIRGAGNLLGGEQHGHMDTIGYDLYCKLLANAIKEEKGEVIEEVFETTIDININAYIPAYYIKNEEQKLMIYKKISQVTDNKDYFEIQEEIEDRYGDIPTYVQNLLDIALLKAYAVKLYIVSIKQNGNNITFSFKENASLNVDRIITVIKNNTGILNFVAGTVPKLNYKIRDKHGVFKLSELQNILKEIL